MKRRRDTFEADDSTEPSFRSEYRHYRTRKQTKPDVQAIKERTLAQMMKGNLAVAKGKAKLDDYDNKENASNNASNSLIQNNQAISNGKGNSAVLRNLHPHHQRIEIDLRLDRNEAGRRLKDGRCVVCAVASDASILACAFCERDTCVQCVNRCASCDGIFCRLCSTTSYAGHEDTTLCLDCKDADRS